VKLKKIIKTFKFRNKSEIKRNYMKNKITIFALLFIFFILAISNISCSKNNIDKNTIYTSMDPIKFIIDNIKSDEINVGTIMKPGSDPHTFEISPKDISLILNSYAYLKIGIPFEENIVDKINKQNKKFNIISIYENGNNDPHIWLSVKIINVLAENILNELTKLYPQNKSIFDDNYKIFIDKLNQIEKSIRFNIESSKIKSFLIIHPALTYFADDYGLTQIPIEEEGKIPTGNDLIELSKKIKEDKIRFIFSQPEFPSRQVSQFIKDNDLKEYNINFLDYNIFNTLILISEVFLNEGKR